MNLGLTNKIAMVAGASRGLGYAVARGLAREGAKVSLSSSKPEAAQAAAEDPLSDREREVLRLLALGHTNQEIAKTLFISVRTAETHRAHIMQKLRINTRAELVRYAIAQRLLDE